MAISHPSEIDGLEGLWLADEITPQTDDTDLDAWPDTSGNDRHMTQATAGAKPHYRTGGGAGGINGWPCVEFNGSSQIFDLPNFLTGFSAGDIFIVLQVDADPPATQPPTGIFKFGASAAISHHPFTDGNIYNSFGTNSRKSCGNPTPSLASLHIAEFWSASGDWGARINKSNLFTTSTNTVAWTTSPQFGGNSSGDRWLDGRVLAVILYSRTLSVGERSDLETWLDRYFSAPNAAPDKPTITVDDAGETSVDLSGSAFSDPDGDAHAASQWQVDVDAGDFSSPVFDSGVDQTNLTSINVSGLAADTDYKARVRYQDDLGKFSDWSAPENFSTLALSPGYREFQADFRSGIEILTKASLDRRPDAVSLDYLTSFTPGPVGLGDNSQGLVSHVWRVRADDSRVYYSRERVGGWEPEQVLFEYTGAPILELDAAFEQAGRIVVVAERATGEDGAPEVWIYWFDPQLEGGNGAFTFDSFGAGRTPRVILDNPFDVSGSDVQVFYVSDGDDEVVYRQQRDRYDTPISTPMTGAADLYLEEVAFTQDKRILILASRRNQETGKYTLEKLYSKLFPQFVSESMALRGSAVHASLSEIVQSLGTGEALGIGAMIAGAGIEDITTLVPVRVESLEIGGGVEDATLVTVVIRRPARESLGVGGSVSDATLALVVIRQNPNIEALEIGGSVASASLTLA